MDFICRPSRLEGEVTIPGSKSHTIRAVILAGLAEGESRIEAPLDSGDTRAAVRGMRALGADIECRSGVWTVAGVAGAPRARRETVIDVQNSGTSLRTLMGAAALLREGDVILTGDEQIQRRPAGPLADALNDLGTEVCSLRDNGCAPFRVGGGLRGGRTSVEAVTSQYVTALLLCCPLADGESRIDVPVLNERPYVWMTLDWLRRLHVQVEHDEDLRAFRIPGGQGYSAFQRRIPADFSSATFFLLAGALPGNRVVCRGLDLDDTQADKAVVDYLRAMGADVTVEGDAITVEGRGLRGVELDLNATPDALPAMAVAACFAEGVTTLRNVPHARIKETDRIAVMACELRKLGADVRELPDGLVIAGSPDRLHGAVVEGRHDHRVVMALVAAGLHCPGRTVVTTAESAGVSFPDFADLMRQLGARLETGGEVGRGNS